jgi:hypothetical protein
MLKFKEVSYDKLKKGIKYVILQQIENKKKFENKIYIGIFKGPSEKYPDEVTSWEKTYITYSTNNNYLNNKKIYEGDIELNKYTFKRKYMELNSQKEMIQNNMEYRALNIILRAIIGDKHFSYQ